MRIILDLQIPDRNPSIYWLHIDINCIAYIKHLKEKIKKVLKESRDIELCLDGVLFFDEDDIYVINENEEIIVTVKENSHIEPNKLNVDTSILSSNGILSTEVVDLNSENDNTHTDLSTLAKGSKKRLRKRTHKKKEPISKSIEQFDNSSLDTQVETCIIPSSQPSKMHKRFKLNDNCLYSESSNEEHFHVTNEVFHYNSLPLNCENKMIKPVLNKEKQLKSKFTKVPIFVRGQISTPNHLNNSSYSESENHTKNDTSIIEDDIEVIDWNCMSKIKITNISELQIHDKLQFKILVLNELGEAAVSSAITTRLEHVSGNTLLIEVLSGIKEFIDANHRFNMENQEDIVTRREIEFQDLYELVKLV